MKLDDLFDELNETSDRERKAEIYDALSFILLDSFDRGEEYALQIRTKLRDFEIKAKSPFVCGFLLGFINLIDIRFQTEGTATSRELLIEALKQSAKHLKEVVKDEERKELYTK